MLNFLLQIINDLLFRQQTTKHFYIIKVWICQTVPFPGGFGEWHGSSGEGNGSSEEGNGGFEVGLKVPRKGTEVSGKGTEVSGKGTKVPRKGTEVPGNTTVWPLKVENLFYKITKPSKKSKNVSRNMLI